VSGGIAAEARAALARQGAAASIEEIWRRAALETLASGRLIDPPVLDLKRLTTPARAWLEIAPWPRNEAMWHRIGRLFDCHHLAIASGDRDWLAQLDQSWEAADPELEFTPLRARGEIGLGLAPGGPRPGGWTPDEIQLLIEEEMLVPAVSFDHAWVALATGDLAQAREGLRDYETAVDEAARANEARPDEGLRRVLANPGTVLRVDARALRALIEAAERR
jgi:hypothetical protein